jgi:hypothetical protein
VINLRLFAVVIMRNALCWDAKFLTFQRNLLVFILYPEGGGSTRLQGLTLQKTVFFKCIVWFLNVYIK